ncbi:hypothetical protein A2U01_0081809, partial [Trifolium medium]|nr:hypothetical protein [Trifolium medium]
QSLTGPRAEVSANRKNSSRIHLRGEEATSLLPGSNNRSPNRPAHQVAAWTTRHGGQDAQMVPRAF